MTGKDLRIVFMGTPDFAVESLKALVENGYNVVGVITAPDKPAGRGQKIAMSAVKKYALTQQLHTLQPAKMKDPLFLEELRALKADLQVVVAFRMLPEVVWDMPPKGTFNLHGSLLPKYRGAAPLNWAIMNGEKETGVTTFLLQHKIDTGNILFQEKTAIGKKENVEAVHDKLMVIGAGLVLKTVDALADSQVKPVPQDALIDGGAELTHAPKIFKEDCLIDWSLDGKTIYNKIRGLSPYPTAWTKLLSTTTGKETTAKIFEVEFVTEVHQENPGTLVSDGKNILKVACADGWLSLTDLQLAGKKRMKVVDLLRGFQYPEQYRAQ